MDTTTALRLRPLALAAFKTYWLNDHPNATFKAHRQHQEVFRDVPTEEAWQFFWKGYKSCHQQMMSLVLETVQ